MAIIFFWSSVNSKGSDFTSSICLGDKSVKSVDAFEIFFLSATRFKIASWKKNNSSNFIVLIALSNSSKFLQAVIIAGLRELLKHSSNAKLKLSATETFSFFTLKTQLKYDTI